MLDRCGPNKLVASEVSGTNAKYLGHGCCGQCDDGSTSHWDASLRWPALALPRLPQFTLGGDSVSPPTPSDGFTLNLQSSTDSLKKCRPVLPTVQEARSPRISGPEVLSHAIASPLWPASCLWHGGGFHSWLFGCLLFVSEALCLLYYCSVIGERNRQTYQSGLLGSEPLCLLSVSLCNCILNCAKSGTSPQPEVADHAYRLLDISPNKCL